MSHVEKMEKILECVVDKTKAHLDGGADEVDTHELYEVADIIKDITESMYKAQIVEAMKKADEEDELMAKIGSSDTDDRRYYNSNRYADGRYAPRGRGTSYRRGYGEVFDDYPDMHYPIMRPSDRYKDRMYYDDGRMGYNGRVYYTVDSNGNYTQGTPASTSGSTMGYSDGRYTESRYDRARRGYTETKANHMGNSAEDKTAKMQSLEEFAKEMTEDITSMVSDATPEEKALMRQKISMLASKI